MAAPMVINLRKFSLIKVVSLRPLFNSISSSARSMKKEEFDTSELDILVCPLSKKPLRYNAETNELISDEIKVAYPIINGIPNLIPQDARMIKDKADDKTSDKQ